MPVLERVAGEEALARVREALGPLASSAATNHGDVDVTCSSDDLVEVVSRLRDGDGVRCRYFTFLSAIDRSEFPDLAEGAAKLEVLIHLYSPEYTINVNVHVPLDSSDPRCRSISEVFKGALWHERECWEMFGIVFEGHPNLVGLYLPEDFEGHPGLKSFKLPSRALVKDWPGAKDPDEAAAGGR